jgi:hypothetical protein
MGGLMNGHPNQLTREAQLMRSALTKHCHSHHTDQQRCGRRWGWPCIYRGRKLLAERCRGSGVGGQSLGVWLCVYATNDLLTKGGLLSGPPRDSSCHSGHAYMHVAQCPHTTHPHPWPRATRTRASKRGVLGVQVRDSHERPVA